MPEVLNLFIYNRTTSSVSNSASKNLMEKQCKKRQQYKKKRTD
jgi:hypothetical protein